MISFDQWAPQTGSESDPYGLGDAWGGMRQGDLSQTDVVKQLYDKAFNPAWGSQGRTLQEMTGGSGESFFNNLPRVNGKMRVGDNLGSFATDPLAMDIIKRNGGMGALTSYDPTYGNLFDVSSPGGATAYQQLSDLGDKRHNTLNDQAWFNVLKLAAMAAGGAYASGAGVGAEGASAAAGDAALSQGMGSTMSGEAGGTVTGANGMDFTDFMNSYQSPLDSTNPLSSMDFSQAASGVGSSNALLNPELASSFAGDPSIWAAAAQNAASSGLLSSLTQKVGEQAAKTLLGRLMNGQGTSDDYSRLLGALGPAALGYIGGTQQTNALNQMQDKYLALGQPSRDRLEASYQPGFSLMNEPGFKDAMDQSSSSVLNNLSAKGGNPYDNPGAVTQANKYMFGTVALPQLNTYRSQNASSGGLGVNTAGTAGMAGASSTGNALNAVSFGANNLLNPQPTIEDLMRLQAQLGQQSGSQYRLNQGSGF